MAYVITYICMPLAATTNCSEISADGVVTTGYGGSETLPMNNVSLPLGVASEGCRMSQALCAAPGCSLSRDAHQARCARARRRRRARRGVDDGRALRDIEDATGFDLRRCEHFVGTSAGSIDRRGASRRRATRPAGRVRRHRRSSSPVVPERPGPRRGRGRAARRAGAWAVAAGADVRAAGAGDRCARRRARCAAARCAGFPGRAAASRSCAAASRKPGARFDGRLRVAAVDRRSGRRVMFGSPGSPRASVGEAVEASCSVPWLFAPVEIGGREYVDGGVWSATNLDVAPAGRDTHVLCLNPTASIASSESILAVMRQVARSAVSIEALALRRAGRAVQLVAPNRECAEVMGTNFMDREPRGRVLAAGYRQGLQLARE